MSRPLKELHLATRFEDLQTNLPDLKKYKARDLVIKSDQLFNEAQRLQLDGDEEMSYIMYHRFISTLMYVRRTRDYEQDPKYFKSMMGTQKANAAMHSVELLSASLKRRYEQSTKPVERPVPAFNGHSVPSANAASNGSLGSPVVPAATGDWIDLSRFVQLLKSKNVLVIDCRPRLEYAESHLQPDQGAACLNVPAEIVRLGQSAGKIQSQLSAESKEQWALRSIKEHVVLMDWNGSGTLSNTLRALKDSLLNWDQDTSYRNPLLALHGGYEQLLHAYPTFTTNAHFRPAALSQPGLEAQLRTTIENIDYPDIDSIQMKSQIKPSAGVLPAGVPSIDRSNKPAMYEAESRRAEQHRQEYLKAAREIKEKLQAPDPSTEHIQELEYKLMELNDKDREHNETIAFIERFEDDDSLADRSVLEKRKRDEHERERKRLNQSITELMDRRPKVERRPSFEAAPAPAATMPMAPSSASIPAPMPAAPTTTAVFRVPPQIPARPVVPKFDRSVKPGSIPTDANEWPEIVRQFHGEPGGEGHGLTGLKNLGNTCYMNSIMQCLSNTVRLREYFIGNNGYRRHCAAAANGAQRRPLADEMAAILREIWLQKHRHISGADLRRAIGQSNQMFRGNEQQDSHEFLTILLDWLHEDLPHIEVERPVDRHENEGDRAWRKFVTGKYSHIVRLFYGQIKSTIKCISCQVESATYESFSNLSLQLPEHSQRYDISECLKLYFYGERISEWNCPRCRCKRDAIKKLDISRLPPVLVIHLKRFHVDLVSSSVTTYKKNTSFVNFPRENLHIGEHLSPSFADRMRHSAVYDLYAVSNHFGEMNRGHYTAFCKSDHNQKWYKFDDQNVTRMHQNDVQSGAAYILFYATAGPTTNSQLQR